MSGRRDATPQGAPVTKHPFRDSAIVYAVLAVVILGLAALTGGDLGVALLVAALYLLVATAWSWWRLARRRRALAVAVTADDDSARS